MNDDHATNAAAIKILVAWTLTFIGGVTLQMLVQLAALVYTMLQIYLLVRDRIIKRRVARESRRMELDSRPHHHGEPQ